MLTNGFDPQLKLLKLDAGMVFYKDKSKTLTNLLQLVSICTKPLSDEICAGEERCIAMTFTNELMRFEKHSTYY